MAARFFVIEWRGEVEIGENESGNYRDGRFRTFGQAIKAFIGNAKVQAFLRQRQSAYKKLRNRN